MIRVVKSDIEFHPQIGTEPVKGSRKVCLDRRAGDVQLVGGLLVAQAEPFNQKHDRTLPFGKVS